jgi:hypothetical protein
MGPHVRYALEGSVFIGGAVVQWLRDGLGLIRSAGSSTRITTSRTRQSWPKHETGAARAGGQAGVHERGGVGQEQSVAHQLSESLRPAPGAADIGAVQHLGGRHRLGHVWRHNPPGVSTTRPCRSRLKYRWRRS